MDRWGVSVLPRVEEEDVINEVVIEDLIDQFTQSDDGSTGDNLEEDGEGKWITGIGDNHSGKCVPAHAAAVAADDWALEKSTGATGDDDVREESHDRERCIVVIDLEMDLMGKRMNDLMGGQTDVTLLDGRMRVRGTKGNCDFRLNQIIFNVHLDGGVFLERVRRLMRDLMMYSKFIEVYLVSDRTPSGMIHASFTKAGVLLPHFICGCEVLQKWSKNVYKERLCWDKQWCVNSQGSTTPLSPGEMSVLSARVALAVAEMEVEREKICSQIVTIRK